MCVLWCHVESLTIASVGSCIKKKIEIKERSKKHQRSRIDKLYTYYLRAEFQRRMMRKASICKLGCTIHRRTDAEMELMGGRIAHSPTVGSLPARS